MSHTSLNYHESLAVIKEAETHLSADFYRTQFEDTIPIGVFSEPWKTLTDIHLHGTDEAKAELELAKQCGKVKKINELNGVDIFDVVIPDNMRGDAYTPMLIAMQIAYPSLYKEYFGGELVWDRDDERLYNLMEMQIEYITHLKKYPSDWFGRHTDKLVKKKVNVRVPVVGYKEWVAACIDYKSKLSSLYTKYIEACKEKKSQVEIADMWLENERAKLLQQYNQGIKEYTDKVNEAREAHATLKALGKPKRN